MDHWKNKIVLLTGASSGIGEAVARILASRGATVGLLARREAELSVLAGSIEEAGGTARVFACDVTDAEAVRKAADSLFKEFGRIDVLIANAGIGGNDRETREIQADAVAKVININLIGAVNSVAAVLPGMLAKGSGHLVAVSSLAGFRGLPKSAAYSGSKAGMTAFFESLRVDFKGRGIDVTILQPGFIRTPLTSGRKKELPFLLELEDGALKIVSAIERKKAFYAFPWQLATIVRIARYLPARIYDAIAGRASYRE
jgi:short-subunit dehydrogenase